MVLMFDCLVTMVFLLIGAWVFVSGSIMIIGGIWIGIVTLSILTKLINKSEKNEKSKTFLL